MKINNLIFVFLFTMFISNTNNLYSTNNQIPIVDNETIALDAFGCRTVTIGINVFLHS